MSYKEKLNFDWMPNAEKNAKKTLNLAILCPFFLSSGTKASTILKLRI